MNILHSFLHIFILLFIYSSFFHISQVADFLFRTIKENTENEMIEKVEKNLKIKFDENKVKQPSTSYIEMENSYDEKNDYIITKKNENQDQYQYEKHIENDTEKEKEREREKEMLLDKLKVEEEIRLIERQMMMDTADPLAKR
jgi:hypothetical protein